MDRFSLRINGICDQSVFRRHGGSLIVCVRASKPSVYLRLDIGASNVWLVLPLTRASGLRELRRLVSQLQLGGEGIEDAVACMLNEPHIVCASLPQNKDDFKQNSGCHEACSSPMSLEARFRCAYVGFGPLCKCNISPRPPLSQGWGMLGFPWFNFG